MDKLYIPYGISIEKESISGFGRREKKHLLIGLAFTAALALIVFLIVGNPLAVIVCGIIGAAGSFQASKRETYSQSVVDIVISMISYWRSQQDFKYVYRRIGR